MVMMSFVSELNTVRQKNVGLERDFIKAQKVVIIPALLPPLPVCLLLTPFSSFCLQALNKSKKAQVSSDLHQLITQKEQDFIFWVGGGRCCAEEFADLTSGLLLNDQ